MLFCNHILNNVLVSNELKHLAARKPAAKASSASVVSIIGTFDLIGST